MNMTAAPLLLRSSPRQNGIAALLVDLPRRRSGFVGQPSLRSRPHARTRLNNVLVFKTFGDGFWGDEREIRWGQKAEDGFGTTMVISRMRARRLSRIFSSFLIPTKKR
jgi:hypothetical protein